MKSDNPAIQETTHEWVPFGLGEYGHCKCGHPGKESVGGRYSKTKWEQHVAALGRGKSE